MLVQVQFEKWIDSARINPDEYDADLSTTYWRLNSRWFKVTEHSDWDGYESTVTDRNQREIDHDPTIKSSVKRAGQFHPSL